MLDLKSLIPWGHKKEAKSANIPVRTEQYPDTFQLLRQEMDKLFDGFTNIWGGAAPGMAPAQTAAWFPDMPSVDVRDSNTKLTISAELPGVDEKDIDVRLQNDILTISAEKKYDREEEEGERYYRECRYGSFSRQIRLPFDASKQKITSGFRGGVLTIEIEKPDEAQSKVKRITIT